MSEKELLFVYLPRGAAFFNGDTPISLFLLYETLSPLNPISSWAIDLVRCVPRFSWLLLLPSFSSDRGRLWARCWSSVAVEIGCGDREAYMAEMSAWSRLEWLVSSTSSGERKTSMTHTDSGAILSGGSKKTDTTQHDSQSILI